MEVYTVRQVAEILRLHKDTVADMLRKGVLKGFRTGKSARSHWRVSGEELEHYIAGNGK